MPKIIKKKPARKKPIEEDEVKSAALQALDKMKERQRQIIIGASVITAIIVIFVITSLYSTSQYKKAGSLEVQASNYYYGENIDSSIPAKERFETALELYRKSIDVKATPTALFYLANTYFKQGDYENAISEYNRFASKFSGEEAILPLVYQKLASAYFKAGQNDKALETLGRLAAVSNGTFRDTALVFEAKYLEGAGEKDKALDKYREIFTQFPDSPWAAEANAKVTAEEEGREKEASEAPSDEKAEAQPAGEKKQVDPAEATGVKGAEQEEKQETK